MMSKQPRNEHLVSNNQRKKEEAERHNARYEYEKKEDAKRILFVSEANPASCSDRTITLRARTDGKSQTIKDRVVTGATYRGIGNYLRGF